MTKDGEFQPLFAGANPGPGGTTGPPGTSETRRKFSAAWHRAWRQRSGLSNRCRRAYRRREQEQRGFDPQLPRTHEIQRMAVRVRQRQQRKSRRCRPRWWSECAGGTRWTGRGRGFPAAWITPDSHRPVALAAPDLEGRVPGPGRGGFPGTGPGSGQGGGYRPPGQ